MRKAVPAALGALTVLGVTLAIGFCLGGLWMASNR